MNSNPNFIFFRDTAYILIFMFYIFISFII